MASALFVVAVLASLATCYGHLCLISPPQRGSMSGLNKPGSDDCILLKSPCGGRPSQAGITLTGGMMFNVTFQKNLDHFNSKNPGYFAVSYGSEQSMVQVAKIPDSSKIPNLFLVTVPFSVPVVTPGKYILQVVYVTNNPQAPAEFYQCADFTLA